MTNVEKSAARTTQRASGHALKEAPSRDVSVVNGRLVSRSLADPDLAKDVEKARKSMFSTKADAEKYFRAKGFKVKSKATPA